jgi:enoyl-CoA hydratase/carnithine racemase
MGVTEFETVIYEAAPPIARITLNRPNKANAVSPQLTRDLDDALRLAARDYEIRVVILKANGKGFCAGHDVGGGFYPEFQEGRDTIGSLHKAQADLFLWPVLNLWEFPKPIVAQVHGYVLGAGTYYALLPDMTIASEDAYFQMPLVQGLAMPGGETMIEPWVFMNFKRAAQYLYTAQTLTAQQALEMGLVNQVVPRDELEATVESIAQHIARAPLSTLMATKALLKRAWELMGLRLHFQMSNDLMAVVGESGDARAFREKAGSLNSANRPRQVAENRRVTPAE